MVGGLISPTSGAESDPSIDSYVHLAAADSTDGAEAYEVKRIEFLGKQVPILLQARNGPCPLLAIANQMLLSGRLSLHSHQEEVKLDALIQMIAERM